MRSWPSQLRVIHPLSRGRHPERPWWRYVQAKHVWRRTDGKEIGAAAPGIVERGFRDKADLIALIANIDRREPLPFPGHRVGQLWAVLGNGDQVESLIAIQAQRVSGHRPWLVNGKYLELDKLERLLEGALLVADLSCPWLAPWAPSVLVGG